MSNPPSPPPWAVVVTAVVEAVGDGDCGVERTNWARPFKGT